MKKGFTLAEVLITLGIIGVVSAMTMPSLIQSTQNKELEVRLKTTYNELNQISQRFYVDNGISFSEWASDKGNVPAYATEFMKYYKGGRKVSDYTYQDDVSKMPYPMYLLGGKKSDSVLCDDGGFDSEVSGKLFFFNNTPPAGVNGPLICVDVNGYQRPNTFGRDIFVFQFTTDNLVIPMGQKHRTNIQPGDEGFNDNQQFFYQGETYCSRAATKPLLNSACSYYALQDMSPKNPDKSYWRDFIMGK